MVDASEESMGDQRPQEPALNSDARRGDPAEGPRMVFFSGGTALRGMSRVLVSRTHNSVHIVTPFDSGGSSAVLRRAFAMPAVGDIRNRLMALADLSAPGSRQIFALFTYRLSRNESDAALRNELERMARGEQLLVALVPEPARAAVMAGFRAFLDIMPDGFDLRGASVGNLMLTAGYLAHDRRLAPAIGEMAGLARVCGLVRPVVDRDMHLAAELEDGSVVVGQHRLTGKETGPIASRIMRLWLTESLESAEPAEVRADESLLAHVRDADMICYPVGSFYTSVVANLLPLGVGRSVAECAGPKVFVPNPVGDPELLGHTVERQANLLRRYLRAGGAPEGAEVLSHVLVDGRASYPGGLDQARLRSLGVRVHDCPLLGDDGLFDPVLLADALTSLALSGREAAA
jgi:CofD-related protein of GAK system